MPVTVPTTDDFDAVAASAAANARAIAETSNRVTVLEERPTAPVIATAATGSHGLWLDDMPGSSDDARLDAAIARSNNRDGTRSPILLSNRVHTFARPRTLFSGLKLINPHGFGNQQRGANSIPCLLKFTGTGVWWTVPDGQTFDVQMSGFGATATQPGATFITSSGDKAVLWTSLFRDLGFLNWSGVFGNQQRKLMNTACAWDGWLNVNNARGVSIHVGGSDSKMGWTNALIDTPQNGGLMTSDTPHVWFDWQEKTHARGLYLTADNVAGIQITGSSSRGRLWISDSVIEGRNASRPATQLVAVSGGQKVTLRDCAVNFQRSGPHVIGGGSTDVSGCDFQRATGHIGDTIKL